MKKTPCLLALFATAFTVSFVPLSAQTVDNLGNVLALGDSITDGFGGNGLGYEAVLKTDLNAAGDTFTFVGTQALMGEPNGTPQDGVPGEVISTNDPATGNNLQGLGGLQQDAPVFLSQLKSEGETPNYILLLIGSNDQYLNFDPAASGSRLGTLLTTLSTDDPTAHIIVSTIPPNTLSTVAGSPSGFNPNAGPSVPVEPLVLQYNSQIPGVVAAHQALGQKVSYVDFFSAITADEAANNRSDLSDGLHPNQNGYVILGNTFAAGVEATVPEPATWVLLAGGVVLLGFSRRALRRLS